MLSTTTILTDTERRASEFLAVVEGLFARGTLSGEYRLGTYVDQAFVDAFRLGRVRTRRARVQVDLQFEETVRSRSGVQLYSVVARWQPAAAPAPVQVTLNAPAAATRGSGALQPVGRSWLT